MSRDLFGLAFNSKQISHAVNRVVRESNLTLDEISQCLAKNYDVTLSPSGISKAIWRGTGAAVQAATIPDQN
jgi:hypothetical protein